MIRLSLFLILSSFIASFIIVAGCMQQPKNEIDYGPEYKKSEVAEALKMAIGDSTQMEIKLNEFFVTDLTRVIRGRAIIDILESVGLSVVKREETERQLQLNLVEEKVTYDFSDKHDNKKIIREYLDCMNKTTMRAEACESIGQPVATEVPSPTAEPDPTAVPSARAQLVSGVEQTSSLLTNFHLNNTGGSLATTSKLVENGLKLFPQMMQSQSDEARVSYHQLRVTDRTVPPPKLVQESPGCGGIPGCLINVRDVEFDQVSWPAYNKGEKVHVKLSTSQDVPYLSRLLEKCQQGSVAIEQVDKPEKDWPRLLVTFCETVRNFQKGE